MSSTDLVVHENGHSADQGALEALVELERAGGMTRVSLELTDPTMPLDTWLAMGRLFGQMSRTINWLIGDWIIFGENAYGEADASQGFDDVQSRYQEAERVTGIDHQVMMNIASICRSVKKRQRCEPLGFWIHGEVTKLPAKEQSKWLKRAVKDNWTRADLRRELRAQDAPDAPPTDEGEQASDWDTLTPCERVEQAARAAVAVAELAPDCAVVPIDAWQRLTEALGD